METLAPAFERELCFNEVRGRAEKLICENADAARRTLVHENRTPKGAYLTTPVNIVKKDLRLGKQ
jgi:hypothetical protein